MKTIEWGDEMKLGIKEIDDQHKKFVEILNQLYEATIQDKAKDVLDEIITRVIEYAEVHFKTEENYFEEFGYEKTKEHKEAHEKLLSQTLAFKKEHEQFKGVDFLSWQLLEFLENWLVDHLETEDKQYVECFRQHGLK